jgi:protein-L-isoaspartate(D-aspartate) O-methyltransferase
LSQELVRIARVSEDEFEREDIANVRFVPLIGEEGWGSEEEERRGFGRSRLIQTRPRTSETAPEIAARAAETFDSIDTADLAPFLERIGDSRVVLIGEASHGTSEFYRMRQRITQALIEEKGFSFVAAEADWPDAARIDHYVRHRDAPASEWTAFARFPTWMWRNTDVRGFVDWLHDFNRNRPYEKRVGFHGLDLYSLYASMQAVLGYLDGADPEAAAAARERYACLSPFESDPAAYGHAAIVGSYRECEGEVVGVLTSLLEKRRELMKKDDVAFHDAVQNARLVANAERYYRVMYYGSRASWNLRDEHMFETLRELLKRYGSRAKAVVWAHNSHVGDASATEMSARGEFNIGELCRREFGEESHIVGFGTDHGTVAAASAWDGPMEVKTVRPSHAQSYERLFHQTELPAFILALAEEPAVRAEMLKPRLERAIGVIYRPESERYSHYFEATLALQFDDYVWFDESSAVTPLTATELKGVPETYPFGV